MSEHEPRTEDAKFIARTISTAELGVGPETAPKPVRSESELFGSVLSGVELARAQARIELGAALGVDTTGGVDVLRIGESPIWESAVRDAASGARLDGGQVVEH